jgi:chitin synthase
MFVLSKLESRVKWYVPFDMLTQVKPGNRGKRDSQLILMRFLNRVHFNYEMSPLELDLYNQIRNVIGVPPNFYEFLFMIDADTEVDPDSASTMIASFIHDTRVIGLCGETGLTNSKQSIITMVCPLGVLTSDTSLRVLDFA